jgi:hypothetical protein
VCKQGFGQRIDRSFELARYFTNSLNSQSNFCLVSPNNTFNVCFWYIPSWLPRELEKQDNDKWQNILSKITQIIHQHINRSGEFQIDHAPLPGKPLFLRIPMHPAIREQDINALINAISAVGSIINDNDLN